MFITFEDDKSVDQEEIKPTGESRQTEIAEPGFTPGPWELRESGLIVSTRGNVRFIARVESHSARLDYELRPQDMADARLIVAAPALYEAARDAFACLTMSRKGFTEWREADDVIAQLRAALALVDGPQER